MKLEDIEIDEEKLKAIAMDAAFKMAKGEIDKQFGIWHAGDSCRAIISRTVDEIVSRLLASDEFKNEIESFCREKFMRLAEEKIANAVARTSVSKLKGAGAVMKPYLVWCPELGQTQADAYLTDAVDARAAACEWAREHDEATAEYRIARGDDITIIVAEAAIPKREVEFIVSGERVPQYNAWMVVRRGER